MIEVVMFKMGSGNVVSICLRRKRVLCAIGTVCISTCLIMLLCYCSVEGQPPVARSCTEGYFFTEALCFSSGACGYLTEFQSVYLAWFDRKIYWSGEATLEEEVGRFQSCLRPELSVPLVAKGQPTIRACEGVTYVCVSMVLIY